MHEHCRFVILFIIPHLLSPTKFDSKDLCVYCSNGNEIENMCILASHTVAIKYYKRLK